MKSKTYVLAILLMFFLTLSCAYATDNQTADNTLLSSPVDDAYLSSSVENELLGSAPSSGINYEDLVIKDINFTGDRTNLHIQGFNQNGLNMSDFTMSIVPASDSSNLDLKMNIPEVNYVDFDTKTFFTFKNLDLSMLPSSNPSSLEFSVIMDSLKLITGMNYVDLTDLNLFFKSFPEYNGVRLDVDIGNFMYTNFNNTSFDFSDLDLNMALGLDGQALATSIILPTLNLVNDENEINLNDLNLNIILPDLKLSNLDLSILMSYFHYSNSDDTTIIDMTDVDVSLEPLTSTSFNSIIRMGSFDIIGNSSGELFPILNISDIDFENFTTGLDLSSVDLSGVVSILDVSEMDLSSLVSYLSSGFDIKTYTDNMPGQYQSSLDFNAVDLSSTGLSDLNISGIDLGSMFANLDYSSLDSSVFNLTGLFDAFGINVSDFGIDMSGYDLSAINMSDITEILDNPDFNMSAITSKLNLTDLDLGGIDISGLITSFNLSSFDISSILAMFNITDFNLTEFMNGFDLNKLLSLFMKKNNTPENGTTPSSVPKYSPVKSTYHYNAAPKTYTVTRASDNQLICKSNLFILEYLNKLFNMTFINGHIKVYIDGKLVFEGDTTDDLTQEIFEIIDEYLGEHEIAVEFTNSEGKSNTYKEKIIVE